MTTHIFKLLALFCGIFSLVLFSSFTVYLGAQQPAFEQSWLYLQDGQQEQAYLSFDPATDVLTVSNEAGEIVYEPAQVLAFSWGGNEYFSMPFNAGHSYFRVLHEGNNFAVLQKQLSRSLLEYFVRTTKGAVQICEQGVNADSLVLCEQELGPGFGMPNYGESSVQYKVENAIFLAVGDQMHLVSCKYDTQGQLFASVPSMQKKNRRLLRRLKQVVQNEQKMQALKKYVASSSADLEDPEQLILALKSIYP